LRIRWSPQAQRDLRAIRSFIAADNPAAAERLVGRIRAAKDRLGRFPMPERIEIGRVMLGAQEGRRREPA
jgi:plasmid stabilization system protein ParE